MMDNLALTSKSSHLVSHFQILSDNNDLIECVSEYRLMEPGKKYDLFSLQVTQWQPGKSGVQFTKQGLSP